MCCRLWFHVVFQICQFVKARHIQYWLVHGKKYIHIYYFKDKMKIEQLRVLVCDLSGKKPVTMTMSLEINLSLHVKFSQLFSWYNPFGGGNKSRHCHCWQGRGGGSKYSIKAIKKTCFLKGSRQRRCRGQRCHVDWHVSGCWRSRAEGNSECGIIPMRFYYEAIEVSPRSLSSSLTA